MAMNFAEKYASAVDERFTQASLTEGAFNQDYDWEGVQSVSVYSVSTSPLNNYSMTGSQRYGVPDELGTTVQKMTLSQDKAFTFTVDRRSYTDQMMVTEAGRALRRQTDEVLIPALDVYRISRLVAGAGTTSALAAITPANAYGMFLNGVTTLLDHKVPLSGTFMFIGTNFFKNIRLDSSFIQASDMAQDMLIRGQVGMAENIPFIFVPQGYLPTGVEFVISNRIAAVAPTKLAEYKTHDNPPGINGWLVEGRVYFDAFVLNNKAYAIYVHRSE